MQVFLWRPGALFRRFVAFFNSETGISQILLAVGVIIAIQFLIGACRDAGAVIVSFGIVGECAECEFREK